MTTQEFTDYLNEIIKTSRLYYKIRAAYRSLRLLESGETLENAVKSFSNWYVDSFYRVK